MQVLIKNVCIYLFSSLLVIIFSFSALAEEIKKIKMMKSRSFTAPQMESKFRKENKKAKSYSQFPMERHMKAQSIQMYFQTAKAK